MKKKFKKITSDFPTIKEMDWDIQTLKTCTETFEYLTEAFWLHDVLDESVSRSNMQKTHTISSVLCAFEYMNELINSRISYAESMIEQNIQQTKNSQLKENEDENSLLN